MVKVMSFGTFDGFHDGHEYYLKEAKKLGSSLVVVIALDQTVFKVKGRLPRRDQEHRKREVEALGIADKVILGNPGDKLKVIIDEKPDILALGYDQTAFIDSLENLKSFGLAPNVVRIPSFHPDIYKSSKLNDKI